MNNVIPLQFKPQPTVKELEASISAEIRFAGLAEDYFQKRLTQLYRMQDYLQQDDATVSGFRELFGRLD